MKGVAGVANEHNFVPSGNLLRTWTMKHGELFPVSFGDCRDGLLNSLIVFLES